MILYFGERFLHSARRNQRRRAIYLKHPIEKKWRKGDAVMNQKMLAQKLKQRREERGITIQTLGHLMQIPWPHIMYMEKGERPYPEELYERVLKKLDSYFNPKDYLRRESYACTLTVAPDGSVKLPKRVLETLHVNPKTVAQEDRWMEIRNYDKRIEITPPPLFDFAWTDAVEDRIKRWMKKKGDASA